MAATAALVVVFWVLRDYPDVPTCFFSLSPTKHGEIDAYRVGAVRLHVLAGALLCVSIVWLSSAGRRERGLSTRPGFPTVFALLLALVPYVANVFNGQVLADAGIMQLWFGIFLLPVAVLIIGTAVVWTYRRRRQGRLTAAVGSAWVLLVIVVPAHYALLASLGQPFCMS
jgi:hypothetical protein